MDENKQLKQLMKMDKKQLKYKNGKIISKKVRDPY